MSNTDIQVLDLFSGIGGFSYGLKQAGGFRTVAYCEIEKYAQKLLLARMEGGELDSAPIHTDITKLDGRPLRGHVDLICGGFPCQDLSVAGKQAGIDGERSGLWGEYARLIREIRPRYVLVENVPNLLVLGMHRVLGDMAASGYSISWSCISASEMEAPHKRDRVWIISELADSDRERPEYKITKERKSGQAERQMLGRHGKNVADSDEQRLEGAGTEGKMAGRDTTTRFSGSGSAELREYQCSCRNQQWACSRIHEDQRLARSGIRRVSNGIPHRVDRLKALGNSIVPQIATYLGHQILEASR